MLTTCFLVRLVLLTPVIATGREIFLCFCKSCVLSQFFWVKSQNNVRFWNTPFYQCIAYHFFGIVNLHPHFIVFYVEVKWTIVDMAMIIPPYSQQ